MKNLFLALFVLTAVLDAKAGDVPATHGMLVFGEQKTYLSHLPMFHSPHDYQVVLKVKFGDIPRSQTLQSYEHLKTLNHNFFTIEPEVFDLTKVIEGEITKFQALLYDGHFERGGDPIGFVNVVIESVIFANKLEPQPILMLPQYFVFGENGEYYAFHLINEKPSFDQIVRVSQIEMMSFRDCQRPFPCPPVLLDQLVPDSDLPMVLQAPSRRATLYSVGRGATLGQFFGPQAKVLEVLYTEKDELAH